MSTLSGSVELSSCLGVESLMKEGAFSSWTLFSSGSGVSSIVYSTPFLLTLEKSSELSID